MLTPWKLNTPWTIPIVYRFVRALLNFMFVGFVKSIPLTRSACRHRRLRPRVRTFFLVVLPCLSPRFISVGILEIMWVWNDYLLVAAMGLAQLSYTRKREVQQ